MPEATIAVADMLLQALYRVPADLADVLHILVIRVEDSQHA